MTLAIPRFLLVSLCAALATLPARAAVVNAACGDPATPIAEIQGSGAPSPLNGQTVSIEAVVTADFGGTDGFGGFFVQQDDSRRVHQPGVSEGLFVYAPKLRAKAGDMIHLSGKVEEKYGQTQLTLAGAIAVCASGQSVTPATLTLPVADPSAFAAVEGMLVRVPQKLTVSEVYELGRYGSVLLSNGRLPVPTNVAAPVDAKAQAAANARNRLILDDGSNKQNPLAVPYPAPGLSAANTLRVGYTVENVEGVMEKRYDAWRLQPVPGTAAPSFDASANPRGEAPARHAQADLRVASFNVLNYFNGDGKGGGFDAPDNRGAPTYKEFQRQEAKIVKAITALQADVIGLMEIANNGYGELSAVRQLAARLGDGWRVVDPGTEKLGGDAIKVALLYNSRSVEPIGKPATLAIDNKNRQPLAQTFRRIGGARGDGGGQPPEVEGLHRRERRRCRPGRRPELLEPDARARRRPGCRLAGRQSDRRGRRRRAADRRHEQLRKGRSDRAVRGARLREPGGALHRRGRLQLRIRRRDRLSRPRAGLGLAAAAREGRARMAHQCRRAGGAAVHAGLQERRAAEQLLCARCLSLLGP